MLTSRDWAALSFVTSIIMLRCTNNVTILGSVPCSRPKKETRGAEVPKFYTSSEKELRLHSILIHSSRWRRVAAVPLMFASGSYVNTRSKKKKKSTLSQIAFKKRRPTPLLTLAFFRLPCAYTELLLFHFSRRRRNTTKLENNPSKWPE